MTEKLFYLCALVGLIVGGVLLHVGQHIPLRLVFPSLAAAAVILVILGRWQKRRGMFK
jgi:hypothetical protein